MAFKILIPYNFTRNDEKVLHFVGENYHEQKDVDITLFHAFTAIPEIDVKNNPIMEKMKSNMSYLRMQQEERRLALEEAVKMLMNYGIAQPQIHCLFAPIQNDIAADIIRLWKNENYDLIVLNRNPGNIINYFTRSTSKRITGYKNGEIRVHLVN